MKIRSNQQQLISIISLEVILLHLHNLIPLYLFLIPMPMNHVAMIPQAAPHPHPFNGTSI